MKNVRAHSAFDTPDIDGDLHVFHQNTMSVEKRIIIFLLITNELL